VAILPADGKRRPAAAQNGADTQLAHTPSFAAACSLRTVAQFRVVTVAPAIRENTLSNLLSSMPVEHHR